MQSILLLSILLFQLEPLRMHGQVQVASPFLGHESCAGYMEFINDGFELVLFKPAAWLESELDPGKQTVWIVYRKDPVLRVALSGVFISLAPSDPYWRQVCKDLNGFTRFEERIVSILRDGDKVSIGFLMR
jgi:hypothetical protein